MRPQSARSPKASFPAPQSAVPAHSRIRAPRRAASGLSAAPNSTPKSSTKPRAINGTLRSDKVDANPRSYDRRDPFTAFNTLIKLLTSLPSRVIAGGGAGCQYKLLTIDEHKLCLHLCNIVEPFLLSSLPHGDDDVSALSNASDAHAFKIKRPRVLLVRQPTEILDRIAACIETREDLMNFGITCRRLYEVVFPRHWEYRVIRAKLSMIGVWKHLCERADLAANVRVVEVLDERSEKRVLVPRMCRKPVASSGAMKQTGAGGGVKAEEVVSTTSTEEDSSSASAHEGGYESVVGAGIKRVSIHRRQEKYFVAALAKMIGLVRLKWESNHSPMTVLDNGAVWKALVDNCGPSIRMLEVVDNMAFAPLPAGDVEDEEDGHGADELSKSVVSMPYAGRYVTRTDELPAGQSTVYIVKGHAVQLWCSQGTCFEQDRNHPSSMSQYRGEALPKRHSQFNSDNIYTQSLEIVFRTSKTSHTSIPVANEFLVCGRWSHLTSLTLTNLSCFATTTTITTSISSTAAATTIQQNPFEVFLCAHPNLQTLKILDVGPSSQFRRIRTPQRNMLPKLRELHANRDIISMILRAECDEARPLEVIKGFKLIGAGAGGSVLCNGGSGDRDHKCPTNINGNTNVNTEFYQNLKKAGASVKRIELEGWGDLDDIRMLAWSVPGLTWLDVGRRLRPANSIPSSAGSTASVSHGAGVRGQSQAPVTNMVEWAEVLSGFEQLTTFHGVKFFYEISPNALPGGMLTSAAANDISTGSSNHTLLPSNATVSGNNNNMNISMTDRSRIKKNDEIAGVLAWKCGKLRRVDHWDGAPGVAGKVIVLFRDADFGPGVEGKVRWDVRRVRQ